MAVKYTELPALNAKYERRLQLQNALEFQDMNVARTPTIGIYADDKSFFDPSICDIHIGTVTFVDIFKIKDEEEYLMALNYMRGHESQHFRSTTARPYSLGIQRGCEKVLEYISLKEEKTRRRFRKPADYADFADTVLPSMGIYLSYSILQQIVAGIANSIEDGRIERIRVGKFPGFEPLRRYFRGLFWNSTSGEFKDYEDIKDSPDQKLCIICNQILSLATCQVYEKGFVKAYAGTPLAKEVAALMPFIAKGVMARSCRDMAEEVVHISEALAPYIYEVARLSASEAAAKSAFEKALAEMIKKMVESSPMIEGSNISEKNEELDTGENLSSVFQNSDLCITLDDETYDKLMENRKEGNKSGGLMVKREHPKEEESNDGQSSDGKSDGKKPDGKKSGSRQSSKDDLSDGQNVLDSSAGNGSSSEKDGKEDTKGASGQSSDDSGEDTGKESSTASSSKENKKDAADAVSMLTPEEYEDTGAKSPEGKNNKASDSEGTDDGEDGSTSSESKSSVQDTVQDIASKGDRKALRKDGEENLGTANEAEILKAMKEAAQSARLDSERQIESVNQGTAKAKSTAKKKEVLKTEPVDPRKFKDICGNFKEVRRAYKLKEKTPAVMQARINAFARKNRRYLRSLSTPNVSNLDSGSVDPSLAYGLAFGNTEVFRKQGKDKKFDGCVYILLDNSGSMSGQKRTEACKAAAVVEGAFQGLMPMKIVAFDTWGTICHEVIKDWDEVTNNNCCWNFCVQGRDGGGNEDGYDIMIATREILARPERKKLIMILSDGAPGNRGLVKKAVTDARKKGIEVYSIYFEQGQIGSDAEVFRDMYQKDYICCELSQVDENLSKLIKKFSRK